MTGGNNNYYNWFKSHYYFNINSDSKPEILPELPYGVSNHQMVDMHGRKMFLLGGVTSQVPVSMPKSPYWLGIVDKVHGIILPYILVSHNKGAF